MLEGGGLCTAKPRAFFLLSTLHLIGVPSSSALATCDHLSGIVPGQPSCTAAQATMRASMTEPELRDAHLNLVCLKVAVHKEVMPNILHLVNGLIGGHRVQLQDLPRIDSRLATGTTSVLELCMQLSRGPCVHKAWTRGCPHVNEHHAPHATRKVTYRQCTRAMLPIHRAQAQTLAFHQQTHFLADIDSWTC